jgi:MFS family permease
MSTPTKVLLWSSNLWQLGAGMLGPLFAVFAEEVGGNILDISWVWAVYLMVTGVGIVLVGRIGDVRGHFPLMMLGYGLSSLATFAYLLVDSPLDLMVVQVVQGVALALSQPTWLALYDRFSGDGSRDGYSWGLSSGEGYIFSGLAIIAGGSIVYYSSFEILFIVMGTILALATAYQGLLGRYLTKNI